MRTTTHHFTNVSLQNAAKISDELAKPSVIDIILAVMGKPPGIAQIVYSLVDDRYLLGLVYDDRDPMKPQIMEYIRDVDTFPFEEMEEHYYQMIEAAKQERDYQRMVDQLYEDPDDFNV